MEGYRRGIPLLAASIGLVALLGVLAAPGGASPSTDEPRTLAEAPRRVGANSCAARGCHGAVEPVDPSSGNVYIPAGASTTWLHFDPHARAYDVLLEPRSVAIAKLLKGPLEGKPAHEAALCLSCHATVSPPEPVAPALAGVKDGIACESCHGPAEVWQASHLETGWMKKTAAAKALDGMTDLSTPGGRVRTCVGCHVGDRSRGMDMNHDLIAAGHPRLNFEFSSYLASYPKHWKEKATDRADFEARSWAIGQLVTAKAVLQLLADRAIASRPGAVRHVPAPEAIWPEFSEYECFACHHGLVKNSPLQSDGRLTGKPGRLPWETWPMAMLPDLAKAGAVEIKADSLQAEMEKLDPDPEVVAKLAAGTIQEVDRLITALEAGKLDATRLAPVIQGLAARKLNPRVSWDRATQDYLARLALIRSGLIPDDPALRATFDLLKFPEEPQRYDSPRSLDVVPAPGRER